MTRLDSTTEPSFIIDNFNIAESFSGVCAPLTQDLIALLYQRAFGSFSHRFHLPKITAPVHFYEGRAFYSLQYWPKQLGVLQSLKLTFKTLHHLFFLTSKEKHWSLTVDSNIKDARARLKQLLATGNWNEIKIGMKEYLEQAPTWWNDALLNDLGATLVTLLLSRKLRRSNFLHGEIGPESQALFRNLKHLKNALHSSPETRDYLVSCVETGHFSYAMLKLRNEEFAYLLEDFLEEFGDRGPGELKLETKTYREYPEIFLKILLSEIPEPHYSPSKNRIHFLGKKLKQTYHFRESARWQRARAFGVLRSYLLWIGEQLTQSGAIESREDIFYFRLSEILDFNSFKGNYRDLIMERRVRTFDQNELAIASRYRVTGTHYFPTPLPEEPPLQGRGGSGGTIEGKVVILKTESEAESRFNEIRGNIIVTPSAGPGWIHLLTLSSGLITENGSTLSHSAILCRELGIPTVLAVKNACTQLKDGQNIRLNGWDGTIEVLKDSPADK